MWWIYLLLGVYVLSCVVLVAAVLLQPGKADAAALFGGGASQTAFGPRGAQNVLGWTTWISAGIMIVLALVLSLPAAFGPQSVVRGGEAVPVQQPGSAAPGATNAVPSQEPAGGEGTQLPATPSPDGGASTSQPATQQPSPPSGQE